MVDFASLRLTGFKSFVEPTEMEIRPGLTGIVGPNGCGKSNLLEALRWVMGANSAKALRGAGMEDVIFAGAGARPARSWAEVGLTVHNTNGDAPEPFADEPELDITRRITKHEEGASSVYRVNGREVRARDVQVLFADASSGANSAALVRQGQVSELIHAKPQNRRRILEEAAGVAGLHSRRRESELRLKAAEENLARLEDVIGELEAQKAALARASRQASKYKKLSADIRAGEALLAYLRWREAEADAENARASLIEAEAAVAEATAAAEAALAAREAAREGVEPAAAAEAEASESLRELERERAGLAAELQRAEADARRLASDLERARSDHSRETSLKEDARTALEALETEARAISERDATEAERITLAKTESDAAAHRLAEAEEALEAKAALAAALDERRASAAKARAAAARTADAAMKRLAEAEREWAAARETAPDPALLSKAADERAQAETALERSEALLAEHKETATATEASTNAAEGELRELEKKRIQLQAEIDALSAVIRDGLEAEFPALIEEIAVAPGYENALAAALGDELMASTDVEAPSFWSDHGKTPSSAHLPAQAEPLSAHVRAPLELRRRLAAIGVVPAELGGALQSLLAPGQRLVSRAGDLWRWDGFTSRADARTAAAVRLEQRNRLDALIEDAEATGVLCERARKIYQDRAEMRRDAAAAVETTAKAVANARRELDAIRARHAETERAAERASARLVAAETAFRRLNADCRAAVSEARASAADAELLPANDDLKRDVAEARDRVARLRSEASELRAVSASLSREAETRRTRLKDVHAQTTSWRARAEEAEGRIEALETRIAELDASLSDANGAPERLRETASELDAKASEARMRAEAASEAFAQARNAAREAETAAERADASRQEARERRARKEAEREGAEARITAAADAARELCNAEPEALLAVAGHEEADPMPARDDLERVLDKSKADRERLGAVNLRAEEETTEVEARLEEILSERDDCEEAVRKLRGAISSLNKEGRARLTEAFEKVDANFRSLFEKLFGGGRAELRLIDAEDPLEAGLEIFASPPGKKLSSMALMSGGEQALTASALIFAVFLVNPAPVCVLDEVDAPLDDANVERFCVLLEEMARTTSTRFIVITHHALTMSRMHRLYGVTMVERGVSRLVSVDLTRAEQLVAAE